MVPKFLKFKLTNGRNKHQEEQDQVAFARNSVKNQLQSKTGVFEFCQICTLFSILITKNLISNNIQKST